MRYRHPMQVPLKLAAAANERLEAIDMQKRKIKITVANPAGNITIFVHDKFDRAEYAKIAEQLLAMKEFAAEQVAFVLDAPEYGEAEGKMEMCGLEFCGNATRTFGLMLARELGIKGAGKVFVDVSGADEILTVEVNTDTDYTRVKMPAYQKIRIVDMSAVFAEECAESTEKLKKVKAVDFGGIIHFILPDVAASAENFEKIKAFVYGNSNPPAFGAMFYDTQSGKLIPVVYVKDVDSTYFEGSCASGSASCAIAFGSEKPDGDYCFTLPQPAGTINASVEVRDGKVRTAYIEGSVAIDEPIEVEVEI